MNILQKISQDLMSPNEMLTSILTIPSIFIELLISMNIFITLLNVQSTKKRKWLCCLVLYLLSIFSKFIIPAPFNTIFNFLFFVSMYVLFFKTKIIETIIGTLIPFLLTVLFEMISSQVYTIIFNAPYYEYMNYPIYAIIFLCIVYTSLFIILKLFQKFNINITLFRNINKKDTIVILLTTILGFITVFLQLYISAFYNNLLPTFVILLSILCLIAYFFISLFSIVKTKQLEIATIDNQNLHSYNDNLKSMYDNIRAFKHDFNNIVHAIGGYVRAKDMDGLTKYYDSLFDECSSINNLSALNPETVNNPSIYAILLDKYSKAEKKNIKMELGVYIDLNTLNADIYEISRILGILLDNSIEAAQECENKYINVRFLMDNRKNRQLIIIENTYKDKNVDTLKIFEKSYSTKPHNTGLGLWEVNKILNKHDNLAIYTTKTEEYFSQQLEIYL